VSIFYHTCYTHRPAGERGGEEHARVGIGNNHPDARRHPQPPRRRQQDPQ